MRRTRVMIAVACSVAALATGIGPALGNASAAGAGAPDWTQHQELIASGPDTGFGAAVAISGTTAVVGAPEIAVDGKREAGAAFVYNETGSGWELSTLFVEPDAHAHDGFAPAVAISGSTVVVGAPNHRVGRRQQAGEVFVFRGGDGHWQQVAELRASDAAAGDHFGRALAIEGSTIVVGAPNHAVGTAVSAGEAYVFEDSGRGFVQTGRLGASDPSPADFATSVAVNGSTIVVGEPDRNGGEGAAYVFAKAASGWVQQAQLLARDGGGLFGEGVAVSGSTALIGAPRRSSKQGGAVYVFSNAGHGWKQRQQLRSPNLGFNLYGWSIAMSGKTALVSAHEEPAPGTGALGTVHVITDSGSGWANTATLAAPDGVAGDSGFGNPLSFDGTHGLIGSPSQPVATGIGAAYVFG